MWFEDRREILSEKLDLMCGGSNGGLSRNKDIHDMMTVTIDVWSVVWPHGLNSDASLRCFLKKGGSSVLDHAGLGRVGPNHGS